MEAFFCDTETTGVDPEEDSLLEVCFLPDILTVNKPQILTSLVNFQGKIPSAAKAVHHILERAVSVAPERETVIELIQDMLFLSPESQRIIVAHQAEFDKAFLPELADETWICTSRMAKKLYPEFESYGLQYLRYELELEVYPNGMPHRAAYDTHCCAALYRHMMDEMVDRGSDIGATPSLLAEWLAKPILLAILPLGKHRGERFDWVAAHDRRYLRWMWDQEMKTPGAWDADLVYTLKNYLGKLL